MLKHVTSAVLLAVLASGCAHFQVAPRGAFASTQEQRRRVHTIAWGALESRLEPANCRGAGLASIRITITPLDRLASAVTLGFWTTATFEWTCAKVKP
jgi:hypothetical protein